MIAQSSECRGWSDRSTDGVIGVRSRRFLLLASVSLFLTCCYAGEPASAPGEPIRFLFIGNSYTICNDMPAMFAELMRASGHAVEVASSARGGWTLAHHAASEQTLGILESQSWDYVILQEQSVIPCLPDRREQAMYPAVRALHGSIQRAGPETVLFVTWGRRDGLAFEGDRDFEVMQDQLYAGYKEIADEIGAAMAPVGIAWQRARTEDSALELWDKDGSHPSREGSYLAACVFYSVICRASPERTNYRGGLPRGTAQFLQRVAAETMWDWGARTPHDETSWKRRHLPMRAALADLHAEPTTPPSVSCVSAGHRRP